MPWLQIGDSMRIGYDPTTGERGVQMKRLNKTGAATVKGSLFSPSTGTDKGVILTTADGYDPVAIAYEAGVADGSEVWCWEIGAVCQVLLEDSTASTRGYWARLSATAAGRADMTNAGPPGGTIGALENHMREVGHCAESKSAGTGVLALLHFHVN